MDFEKLGKLKDLPRVRLGHAPTPLETMPRLAESLGGGTLLVKRDDCTGLALGGNKVRQLEFYFGEAEAQGADTILITGAVQSNFVRLATAAARCRGLDCHIQLEERVPKTDPLYRNSGNVLLDRLLGATIHSYPEGEDEAAADRNLREIAEGLKAEGRRPYIIPLAPGHAPLGSLGYIVGAAETLAQLEEQGLKVEEVVVPSGSGSTHAGFLFGVRALGHKTRVTGACVRRDAGQQLPRIIGRCQEIADLLEMENPVAEADVIVDDASLAPGYGQLNPPTIEAMKMAAHTESLILDPVYTGKAMATFIARCRQEGPGTRLFLHTGGIPAIFAYGDTLIEAMG